MGILKVSVDDLLGYSKLQDLLLLLVGRINEQDAAIEQLQVANRELNESFASRLSEAVEALRRDTSAVSARMSTLEALAKEHESNTPSSEALEDLQNKLSVIYAGLADARDRLSVGHSRQGILEASNRDLEKRFQELVATSAAVTERTMALQQGQAAISAAVSEVETRLLSQLSAHDEIQATLSASVKAIEKTAVAKDAVKVARELEARVFALEHAIKERDSSGAQSARAELEALLDKLRADIEARLNVLQARLDLLEDAQKQGQAGMERLRRDLARVKDMMDDLSSQGSAATTKCISCFDSRVQEETKFAIGSDGKVYQHRRSTGESLAAKRVESNLRDLSVLAASVDRPNVHGASRLRPATANGSRRSAPQSRSLPDLLMDVAQTSPPSSPIC